tara:strand:+ start:204 stop:422 length:219 start_codon:yes stop_codon:yes gene_type:complete
MEIVNLGGYGQFVWPAFIFTFVSCSYLYFKTRAELKKQEKIFLNEFNQLRTEKIKTTKRNETIKEVLSGSSI